MMLRFKNAPAVPLVFSRLYPGADFDETFTCYSLLIACLKSFSLLWVMLSPGLQRTLPKMRGRARPGRAPSQ